MHGLPRFFRFLFFVFMVAFCPLSSWAQSEQSAHFALELDESRVESWLGRESRLDHPVMSGVVSRDEATLHFYFSPAYGQRAESVISTAETARARTMRFLPPETVAGVHIYLLGDINAYFEALGSQGRAPDWAAGLTILRDGVILIRLSPRGMSRVEPEMTLAHELNHVALRRFAQDNVFPHWFYEGLAMLVTDDWNLTRAETLGRADMAGRLIELDGIGAAFGQTGAIVDLAYAQSAHFVSWLAKQYGDETMKNLIRETATGTPFEVAFSKNYGQSTKAAFSAWRDSMAREESLWASIFSQDGLFFFISVFAIFALSIALWRRTVIRRRRLAAMAQDIPVTALPQNLRNFGPFQTRK